MTPPAGYHTVEEYDIQLELERNVWKVVEGYIGLALSAVDGLGGDLRETNRFADDLKGELADVLNSSVLQAKKYFKDNADLEDRIADRDHIEAYRRTGI